MFGTLENVLISNWQDNKDNLQILLITEQGQFKYQTFSTYDIIPEDYYISTSFRNVNDYLKFLNTVKSRSNYNYNVNVGVSDKILTLSSCNISVFKRIVLHAKLIKSDN